MPPAHRNKNTVSDNHGGSAVQTVSVTINGTNEAPVINSSRQSGAVTEYSSEHGALSTICALSLHDALPIYSHSAAFAAQGSGYLGSFSLDSTNHDTGNGGSFG